MRRRADRGGYGAAGGGNFAVAFDRCHAGSLDLAVRIRDGCAKSLRSNRLAVSSGVILLSPVTLPRAISGHAAAPPSAVMNARLFIQWPRRRERAVM